MAKNFFESILEEGDMKDLGELPTSAADDDVIDVEEEDEAADDLDSLKGDIAKDLASAIVDAMDSLKDVEEGEDPMDLDPDLDLEDAEESDDTPDMGDAEADAVVADKVDDLSDKLDQILNKLDADAPVDEEEIAGEGETGNPKLSEEEIAGECETGDPKLSEADDDDMEDWDVMDEGDDDMDLADKADEKCESDDEDPDKEEGDFLGESFDSSEWSDDY